MIKILDLKHKKTPRLREKVRPEKTSVRTFKKMFIVQKI